MHITMKERNCAVCPSYCQCDTSFSALFNSLHSGMGYPQCKSTAVLKSTSVFEVTTIKIHMISVAKGNHHMPPLNHSFLLSVKMIGTQKRTLVSPQESLCIQWYAKRNLSG